MRIKREDLIYHVNQLNLHTKCEYTVRFENGCCGIYVKRGSGIAVIRTGLTNRECYEILMAMRNMYYFESE